MGKTPFATETIDVDFCVVGGGIAGICSAIAAARRGASVALIHDRPVFGGNASSEVRMWLCGCVGKNLHETGIVEELQLDNLFFNPSRNYSLWDAVLYGAVRKESRINAILNCSCCSAEMDGNRIVSVTGWQTTTQSWKVVRAKLFADCSGDSVLAPLAGADFRIGREARAEFGESLAHDEADSHTMGMSCLIQARECASPQPFTPLPWARRFPGGAGLKNRIRNFDPGNNYWWLELGGMGDSIADTERVRDDLVATALGLWDYYKNDGDHGAANWALDWLGFLPGKRESRRCLGDVILTQNDLVERREFPDAVAYGGWPLDDHDPHGFEGTTPSNISIKIDTPYQIPYRCLYSRNVGNLFFAGRNISVSHAALSSTRVMCTCGVVGQAVGTAAAIAASHGTTPRGIYESHIGELRQALLEDDCYIPGATRAISEAARKATLSLELPAGTRPVGAVLQTAPLLNGIDRPVGDADNGATIPIGTALDLTFNAPRQVSSIRIVFDSDLNRLGANKFNTPSNYPLNAAKVAMPAPLTRDFRVEALDAATGAWRLVVRIANNHRRLITIQCGGAPATAMRLVPERLWGGGKDCHLFAFDFT